MANRDPDPKVLHYQPSQDFAPRSGKPISTTNGSLASLQWMEELITIATSTVAKLTVSKIPANSYILGFGAIVVTPVLTTSTGVAEPLTVTTPNLGALLADTQSTGTSVVKGIANPTWISADTAIQYHIGDAIPTDTTGTIRLSAWWWNFTPPSQ